MQEPTANRQRATCNGRNVLHLGAIGTFYQILIMQNEGEKAIKPNVPKYEHATNYKMRKLSDLYVVGGVWHSTHCLTEKRNSIWIVLTFLIGLPINFTVQRY